MLRLLLILLLAVFVNCSFPTEVKFNFKPAKNNFELFSPDELKAILEHLKGVKSFNCTSKGCYIELHPLLVDYTFEGFSFFLLPRLERFLGLKLFYRYPEEVMASAADNTLFFLRNRGYLDAQVKTVLHVSKEGYAKLKIVGNEGELYLWGGFQFNGTPCFEPRTFYIEYRKPFGAPFSYIDLYRALDLAQGLCRKKGYLESFVFYREPFGVKRETLWHYLGKNLKVFPPLALDLLSSYTDIFITDPFKGIKFLFKPSYGVYPTLVIRVEELPYKINLRGNKEIPTTTLRAYIEELLQKGTAFSPVALQEALTEFYRSRGFLDVAIRIEVRKRKIDISVREGERYRVEVKIVPPLKGLRLKLPRHYTKGFEQELLSEVKDYLHRKRYLYGSLKIHKGVDRKSKTVRLTLFIENPRKVGVELHRKVLIENRSLRKLVERTLKGYKPFDLVADRGKRKDLKGKILSILKKFGCKEPLVEIKVKGKEPERVILEEKVSCGGIKVFGHSAFWVEGRIKERELSYAIPDFYGKKFRKKLLDALENRLSLSGLFESYSVKRVERENGIIPLVEGVEKRPLSVEGQIGFSSDEGYILDATLQLTDPFGYGSIFRLGYRLTGKRNYYHLSYLDNYFFSRHFFTGADLFKRYEEHRDYDITLKGFSLSLGYHLNLYTDLSLTFISDRFDLVTDFPSPPRGTLNKWTLSGEFLYPLYEGLVKRGQLSGSINLSRGSTGGNGYWKGSSRVGLVLFFGKKYAAFSAAAGYVSPQAPIFEKFYLGGIKDLKGYTYESVAPPGGGEIFWYAGTEVGFPLFGSAYLFTGFDAGASVKRNQNPFGEIKKDIFVGAGSLTGAGPIRFVVALPLENKITLSSLKFLFLVGFNF